MINVLLAEDHAIVMDGIATMLAMESDINIIGKASNGRQMMDLIKAGQQPDIAVVDLHLPEINGLQLTSLLSEQYPDIKVVILTAETGEKYLLEAFKAGAKSYLIKEAGTEEIVFAIRHVHNGKSFICSGSAEKIISCLQQLEEEQHVGELNIQFSTRELEVLQLLANGCTNQQIADRLFTSRRTVEGHRQAMINKTGVHNTPELIKFAMQHKLL